MTSKVSFTAKMDSFLTFISFSKKFSFTALTARTAQLSISQSISILGQGNFQMDINEKNFSGNEIILTLWQSEVQADPKRPKNGNFSVACLVISSKCSMERNPQFNFPKHTHPFHFITMGLDIFTKKVWKIKNLNRD